MPKKINKKIFFLIIIASSVAGFLIWLAFVHQLTEIRSASDDIQKVQLDVSVRKERKQKILELGKELGGIESDKTEMVSLFIEKNNAVPFLEKLESIAAITGNKIAIEVFDLTKLKPLLAKAAPSQVENEEDSKKKVENESKINAKSKTKTPKEDYSNQLGFTISLVGNYGALVDFFTKLENMPYFVRVYNFQITSNEKIAKALESEVSQNQAGVGQENENKFIKSTLTVGVYTNESK